MRKSGWKGEGKVYYSGCCVIIWIPVRGCLLLSKESDWHVSDAFLCYTLATSSTSTVNLQEHEQLHFSKSRGSGKHWAPISCSLILKVHTVGHRAIFVLE